MSFEPVPAHTMLFRRRKGCSNFGAAMPAVWMCAIRHAVEAQNSRNDLDSRGNWPRSAATIPVALPRVL